MNMPTVVHWATAVAVAIGITLTSLIFTFWYQKGIDGLWCSNDAGSGFISIAPQCPQARPFSDTILWLVPLVGIVLSGVIPVVVFRLVANRMLSWLVLSAIIPVFVSVMFTAVVVGHAVYVE